MFLQIKHSLDLGNPTMLKNPPGPTERFTNAVLKCQVNGYPSPTIVWHRGFLKLQESSIQYFINNATFLDEGRYTCTATNMAGTKVSAPLTVTLNCKLIHQLLTHV